MSGTNQRRGCGCFLFSGLCLLVLSVCVACVAGYLVGVHGLSLERGPGVAVLEVFGDILDERPILDQLEALVSNPDTRALVVRVDSPGGGITVVEEVYNALKRARESGLPIVASLGSTGASGGYFVCLAADRIFANQSSLTGSIGVIVEYPSAKDFLDRIGIKFDTIASGEFKAMGSVAEPLTDRQREFMKTVVTDFHAFFVETLVAGRKMDAAKASQLADGRVFTGRQAREAGLIDEIGDLDTAVRYAAKVGGLEIPDGESPRIIREPAPGIGWFEELIEQWGSTVGGRLSRYITAPKYIMR